MLVAVGLVYAEIYVRRIAFGCPYEQNNIFVRRLSLEPLRFAALPE